MKTRSDDFDFLIGDWDVRSRQLASRLVGSHDWESFGGIATCRQILDGVGNFDEIAFPTKAFSGSTIRLFDLTRRIWSLHWSSSLTGTLDPPLFGTFTDGVGDFYGDDLEDGTPVRVHFRWSNDSPAEARWEQSFSVDDGATWESNWIMDFQTRGGPLARNLQRPIAFQGAERRSRSDADNEPSASRMMVSSPTTASSIRSAGSRPYPSSNPR